MVYTPRDSRSECARDIIQGDIDGMFQVPMHYTCMYMDGSLVQ